MSWQPSRGTGLPCIQPDLQLYASTGRYGDGADGGLHQRLWAELTRSFFAGTISDEWRKAHSACVAAQEAALQSIRDGVSARAVDGTARS